MFRTVYNRPVLAPRRSREARPDRQPDRGLPEGWPSGARSCRRNGPGGGLVRGCGVPGSRHVTAGGRPRHAGVDVQIKNYPTTKAELRDLQSGKVDVAYGDYADMFYAQAHALQLAKGNAAKANLNLVVVADGYDAEANTMEVLTMPQSKIVTPKNLAGKSIETTTAQVMPSTNGKLSPYSLETVATQSVLSNDNVTPSSVTWHQLPPQAPPQAMLEDLRTHKVDAILATEPTLFEAEAQLGAVP